MTTSALVIGSDSLANLGDQAIAKTLVRAARAAGYDDVHFASYRPEVAADRIRHLVDTVHPMPFEAESGAHHLRTVARGAMSYLVSRSGHGRRLPEVDVAVFVGGRYLASPYFGSVFTTLLAATELKRAGARIVLAPQTIGPVRTIKEKVALSRLLATADIVMARDRQSEDFLHHFAVAGPRYLRVPDVVYGFDHGSDEDGRAVLRAAGVEASGRPLLAIADRPLVAMTERSGVSAESHSRSLAAAADLLSAEFELVFLSTTFGAPGYDRDDRVCGNQIRSLMRHPEALAIGRQEPPVEALTAAYRQCAALLTTRMHPIIMGMGQGTPVVSLAYEPKCVGQLEEFGRRGWALDLGASGYEIASTVRAAAEANRAEISQRGSELRQEVGRALAESLAID